MNVVDALQSAISGWIAIFKRRPEWASHFQLTPLGLLNALVIYGFVALASIFAGQALPSPIVLAVRLMIFCLPLISLLAAVLLTRSILRFETPPLALIVPAVYLLALYLLLGTALNFISPLFNPLLLLALGPILFIEARVTANLSLTNSVAFALLTLVLLVALPASLYMLLTPASGPI